MPIPGLEQVVSHSPAVASPIPSGSAAQHQAPPAGAAAVTDGLLEAGPGGVGRAVDDAGRSGLLCERVGSSPGTPRTTPLDLIPSGDASVASRSDRVRMGGGRVSGRGEIDAAERDYLCRERLLDEFEAYEEIEED